MTRMNRWVEKEIFTPSEMANNLASLLGKRLARKMATYCVKNAINKDYWKRVQQAIK